MPAIIAYTKGYCPYCRLAKQLLREKGAIFEEIDVHENPERLPEMMKRTRGTATVPQIFIDGLHIGGYDDLSALDAVGELDRLLSTVPFAA